eukprot:1142088-Pelagomonas_calceolata.AAC.6
MRGVQQANEVGATCFQLHLSYELHFGAGCLETCVDCLSATIAHILKLWQHEGRRCKHLSGNRCKKL